MSEERDAPAKTPLVDILRRIPADAVYRWESCGELAFASYSSPIGLHAHEAASEITRLRGEVERLRELLTSVIGSAPTGSKYHGLRGFETDRFLTDFDYWKATSKSLLSNLQGE